MTIGTRLEALAILTSSLGTLKSMSVGRRGALVPEIWRLGMDHLIPSLLRGQKVGSPDRCCNPARGGFGVEGNDGTWSL